MTNEREQYRAPTRTTTELRAEIESECTGAVFAIDQRALERLAGLERAGIHVVEVWPSQDIRIAIGDAAAREAANQRDRAVQDILDDAREHRDAAVDKHMAKQKSDLTLKRDHVPEPSKSEWASKYDVMTQQDGSIKYERDGETQIHDRGREVAVAHNPEAIRDAIALIKERGEERINVAAADPEKRQAIMQEAYRQGIGVETGRDPSVEGEYRQAVAAVECERAQERAGAEQSAGQEQHAEAEPEIGD